MRPIDRIAVAYARHGLDFAGALERHYQSGFVFSTPDFFIMGRPEGDAWFVEAMAGDMGRAWDILPWPLPNITFARQQGAAKGLRTYPLERLKRLTMKGAQHHGR